MLASPAGGPESSPALDLEPGSEVDAFSSISVSDASGSVPASYIASRRMTSDGLVTGPRCMALQK